jgi:diacylglycerol kinase (ATP)
LSTKRRSASAPAWRQQTDDSKRRFGFLAILGTTVQVLTHVIPFGAIVEFGDERERLRTIQLTVANSSRFGGIWNIRNTAIDDGWLDLYAVTLGGVRHLRAAHFDVTTRRPHRIEADGEPAGRTPARFEVLSAAIRVFVPADRDATAPDRGTL